MDECLNCGYVKQSEDEYILLSPLECPHCGVEYGVKPYKKIAPFYYKGKKCLNCGYERTFEDDQIVFSTECPKCLAIYEKIEQKLLQEKQERERRELKENNKTQSRERREITIALICLFIGIVIISLWVFHKYNDVVSRQEKMKNMQNATPSADARFYFTLPPDMKKESDMRRDVYDAANRGAMDALYEHDNDPRTKREMERIAEEKVQEAILQDRMLHRRHP